ncbi:MAG: ribosome silencing factor [Halofilum sp. (in: g-proteobacteria)]|nr:ribosome silencing factor [Halofilum sp. (in: g-proteobacteria)]
MTRDTPPSLDSDALADVAADALDDLKGVDVRRIDVREKTSITDVIVIASGTSERHVRSLADRVVERVKEAGTRPLGVEGERGGDWLLIDLGDVVVHVMSREKRDFYNLEKLWSIEAGDPVAGSGPAG